MTALGLAILAAIAFAAASLLGLVGNWLPARARAGAIAVAAGILLVVAIGDLLPESIAAAGHTGIAGFIGGFAFLFMIEAFTHAHTHHAPDEPLHEHSLLPFVIGLAIHNLADGFALGVAAGMPGAASGLVGFGVLVHQAPVGLSLAAVFAAGHASRASIVRVALLLALAIPVATAVTIALPAPTGPMTGILAGVAGGILTYLATAHLLPEAQAESPRRLTALVFLATLVAMTWALTAFGE